MQPAPSHLGIDLGGTKIEACLLDGQGRVLWRTRVATPAGDYPATLDALHGLVQQARAAATLAGHAVPTVGIGTPGAVSLHDGRIKNANSTCLNGQPLLQDLEQRLGCLVRSANDANCMLVSECVDGAAQGAETAFGVILGTGVGGALWVRGGLLEGHNRIAGEWGHNPLPWPQADELPGPACYCGRCGCNETWLSGPGLLADYRRQGGACDSVPALLQQAQAGEALAAAAFERYCERLARGLASVINLFDPQVIVLAGGLSQIDALYQQVPQRWARWVFSDTVQTRLLRAAHGDASGVRGAAWLWC